VARIGRWAWSLALVASVAYGSDGSAGARIARQGNEAVAPCASCHGARGEGDAASRVPRIAGQSRAYLAHQLESYANGRRASASMTPIARALSTEQRRDVAAFYASLDPRADPAIPAPRAPADIARARTLATLGDRERRIQGCAACHGSTGRGELPAFPYLAGQHAGYLADALRAWRDGTRDNDPSEQMPSIARALGEEDAALLADYFAAQPLTGPVDRRLVPPGDSPARR
jgi:cytochrome c553